MLEALNKNTNTTEGAESLNKALEDAKEVHGLFLEMLESEE